jgi:hypothetical protein
MVATVHNDELSLLVNFVSGYMEKMACDILTCTSLVIGLIDPRSNDTRPSIATFAPPVQSTYHGYAFASSLIDKPILSGREAEEHITHHNTQVSLVNPYRSTTSHLRSSGRQHQNQTFTPRAVQKMTISAARTTVELAKDMLMRVGFEPTPFRTSDCIDEPRMVSP